eukprot:PITA_21630
MEAVKAMLHDQKLPKFLWGEATNIVAYVQNRSPHRALNNKTLEEVFIGEKLEVGHLRIFGYPVHFHVPKKRRSKLEVSGKKEHQNFHIGKARDTPPPANVESQDDTLDAQEDPEPEPDLVDEPMKPMDPLDPSCDPPARKRPLWLRDTLQDVDIHATPRGTFKESKKPCKFQGYIVAMSNIIQVEHCIFEETVKDQVWKDAMAKEYESIIHNDVWDVVPRPKGKFFVTLNGCTKLNMVWMVVLKNIKLDFVARGFSQKKGVDYDEIFTHVAQYTTI